MTVTEEVQAQVSRARETYPFLPARVRVDAYPTTAMMVADFQGFDAGTAVLRMREADVVLSPWDMTTLHEAAHAGHALLVPVWYGHMLINLQQAAKAADPVLQAFWRVMRYTTPLAEASVPRGHDDDPVEHFAIVFSYVVTGYTPPPTPIWARYGGTYNRAELDTFFRGLLKTVAAGGQVAPVVLAAPAATVPVKAVGGGFINLIDELPRAPWSIGTHAKTSITVHWNGTPIPADVGDMDVIFGDAAYHMTKDWSEAAGQQLGDGIMYHRLYGRDGTVYLTRYPGEILWHCGSDYGNLFSEAWQVMCGEGQSVTPAQLAALARDLTADGRDRVPHGPTWSATQCPGDELRAFIENPEADLTPEQFKALFVQNMVEELTPTILAMKAAYDPLVATARENGLVDAEQEAAIAELNNRLERMGAAAQGK